MAFIATRDFRATRRIANHLLAFNGEVPVTALVQHPDHAEELKEIGVAPVYDLYLEAGKAFAAESWKTLEGAVNSGSLKGPDLPGPRERL